MTFRVAALVNIIVALISQSLHRHHTVVHHQRAYHITRILVIDTAIAYISPRAFNDDVSSAAKSSNSDRSFPAGPLRSSLAAPARSATRHEKSRDVRSRSTYTRAPCLRGWINSARIRIFAAATRLSNRTVRRLASIRLVRRSPDADVIHVAKLLKAPEHATRRHPITIPQR